MRKKERPTGNPQVGRSRAEEGFAEMSSNKPIRMKINEHAKTNPVSNSTMNF